MREFRFFYPSDDVAISERHLPHWGQAGTLVFITWRTADSMPRDVTERLSRERTVLLERMDVDPAGDWEAAVEKLPAKDRVRVKWALFQAWDGCLDRGAGACELRPPELAAIVEQSLLHFDEERY